MESDRLFKLGESIGSGTEFTEAILYKRDGYVPTFHDVFTGIRRIIAGATHHQTFPIKFIRAKHGKYFTRHNNERTTIRSIVLEFEVPVEEEWMIICPPMQKAFVHFVFYENTFFAMKSFCPDGPQEECVLCKEKVETYKKQLRERS